MGERILAVGVAASLMIMAAGTVAFWIDAESDKACRSACQNVHVVECHARERWAVCPPNRRVDWSEAADASQ